MRSARWAIQREDGFFAHGKPWEITWSAEQDDCMIFERAAHANYLIDKVLGRKGLSVTLLPAQRSIAAG